jgi:hypothetical protein
MTEYEVSDLLLGNSSVMYMDGAAFMTLLSAYIVIVHLVGRTLTRFQIIFINFTFIGLALSSVFGWLVLSNRSDVLLAELARVNSASPLVIQGEEMGSVAVFVYFTFRSLVLVGALIYMWQVRKSVAENDT